MYGVSVAGKMEKCEGVCREVRREVWKNVLGCGGSEKRCGKVCGGEREVGEEVCGGVEQYGVVHGIEGNCVK